MPLTSMHPTPVDAKAASAASHGRMRPNGGKGQVGQEPSAKPKVGPSFAPANTGLRRKLSAVLRDQLLSEIKGLNSAEGAAVWARRVLPAKNSLDDTDAQQLEEAFEAKLTELNGQPVAAEPSGPNSPTVSEGDDVPEGDISNAQALLPRLAIIDSELARPEPRRIRDKDHLQFVATQPCLICGRTPADPHHLRFTQHSALGRKVSDEFTVPLCRGHHREVHRYADEAAWWQKAGNDPTAAARALWLKTHPLIPIM